MSSLLPARWLRVARPALPLLTAALLLIPLASRAARDEVDVYTIDDYRYDRDGPTSVMRPEDDPGNGGPAPTSIPLGSDLASTFVALAGAWYARRSLRAATHPGAAE